MATRTHPADVTADRLGKHYEQWYDKFDGREREAISIVRNALQRIAEQDDAIRQREGV